MTRGLGGQSAANAQNFLKGIEYPASKIELVNQARDNDAPREILEAIRQLPDADFDGPQDVMKAYGKLQ